jgi:hypothetical protein
VFVDRWHPLRISTYNAIGGAFGAFNGWIWLFITLPSAVMFWPALIGSIAGQFSNAMGGLCGIAMFMRLMPRSLYGQFSAASSVIRAIGRISAGVLAGLFLDLIRWLLSGSSLAANFGPDFVYRFGFLWGGVFSIMGAIITCMAYREWLRLGGDQHYQAPAPWLPEGREPPAGDFKSVSSVPRWLRAALYLGLVALAMNLALYAYFTYEMYHSEKLGEIARWYAHVWWPFKLWITVASLVQVWQIFKDIRAHERGEKTFFGLPHHGIMMVGTLTGLASFPTTWLQTQWIINLGLSYELYILGIANLVCLILGPLNVQVIRWIERALKPDEEKRLQELIDRQTAGQRE